MGRSTGISRSFSLLRAGSAATIALATILSCSDSSTAPSASPAPSPARSNPALAGIRIVHFQVADFLKHPKASANKRTLGAMNISHAPSTAAKIVTPSIYTVKAVSFNPEPKPVNQLSSNSPNSEPICDDCVAIHVPIGFDFTFYGNSYSELQISSNGLIKMGSDSSLADACCDGRQIPLHDAFDNIIAVAWTDLSPSAAGDITFETQGIAPNRKFVVQWNNVPEFSSETPGHVTAQVVLSEGSNDITINTLSEDFRELSHVLTQGIENFDGTEAAFVEGRVGALFGLTNDAVRFSLRPPYQPIKVVAAANLVLPTIPRACFGTVTPAQVQPTVTGGDEFLTVSARRSDELALGANYPKGVTIITWSATDSTGGTVIATQTVTIADREAPQIFLPSNAVVRNDPGLATAVVNVGVGRAEDNCSNSTLSDPPNGVYPVGTTSAVWTARDEAGNVSTATQLVTVKDVEAPTLKLSASITVNATSPYGAVVPLDAIGHDNVGVTSISCTRITGTKFPIGWTLTSCSALDAAGNKSAPAPLWVNVLGAEKQIDNLIASIRAVLPKGGEWDDDYHHSGRRGRHHNELLDALLSPLGNSRNLRGACPSLDLIAFIVRGNTPSIFPTANSTQILGDVARIKNVIGCR
jgi:hypothetical protein